MNYNYRIMTHALVWVFLLCTGTISAQNLAGIVLDENRSPVIGAYVLHQDMRNHAHTNAVGEFFMTGVAAGDTLIVSSIGYKTQSFVIANLDDQMEIVLEEESYRIDEVVIQGNTSAMNQMARIDLIRNPVQSSQEILRVVPGLFLGQHAGGGKAEQIFLRGFDIDHGTDLRITVEGMPVNKVSHAHGQGYADMHFIIPEAIQTVEYNKGPYDADIGNFATAGYVDFQLKDRLEENMVAFEYGEFNTSRFVGMFDVLQNDNNSLYVATEYRRTDGFFDASQNFDRLNLMARYSGTFADNSTLSATVSHFTSEWDASGQIPLRAVNDGTIGRFGAIDDTEGGNTSRTSAIVEYNKRVNPNTFIRNNVYYARYDFELWSNFTFFLEDPVNGDQIVQREVRDMFGAESTLNHSFDLAGYTSLFKLGVGFRDDDIQDNELSNSVNRQIVEDQIQFGDVRETNTFGYAELEWQVGGLMINPGVRFDNFSFNYYDRLATLYDPQTEMANVFSPKLNLSYNLNSNAQVYFKSGYGFHSNDTRVVIAGEAPESFVPQALGADLGFIWKPSSKLLVQAAGWYLNSEQEFVYVGDAGIVEPSGETQRLGIDFSLRYQLLDWLYFDTDWTFTDAQAVDEPEEANLIPLAPIVTGTGGLSFNHKGFNGGLRFRYLGDRPANEDDSITAEGWFVADLNLNYRWKNIGVGLIIENILDTEWEETQFATESRLFDEAEPVEEIHFTPGAPRWIRGRITYNF